MKRLSALLFALEFLILCIGNANAEELALGSFSKMSPMGHPEILGTPARMQMPFFVGLSYYGIENASDYGSVAANTAFNISKARVGAVVEYTSLDILYERISTQWEVAVTGFCWGAGIGYNLNVERVVKEQNFASQNLLLGGYGKFPDFILYSVLVRLPGNDGLLQKKLAYAFSVQWFTKDYRLFAEYEVDDFYEIKIGQELLFGSWAVETAFAYPGSRLYLGFNVWWGNFRAFSGVAAVSKYYQGRLFRLEYANPK